MKVVYAVEVHVFSVPGKGRLPHTKIKVGSIHSRDLDTVLHHRVKDCVEVIDIPLLDAAVGEGTRDVCTIQRLVEGDILPVFSLQLIKVFRFGWLEPECNISTS